MTLQITLRLPNGSVRYKRYDGVQALVNPHTHVLQIFQNKFIIAEYQSDAYLSWQYVASPQQPTSSRAGQLLQPQGV